VSATAAGPAMFRIGGKIVACPEINRHRESEIDDIDPEGVTHIELDNEETGEHFRIEMDDKPIWFLSDDESRMVTFEKHPNGLWGSACWCPEHDSFHELEEKYKFKTKLELLMKFFEVSSRVGDFPIYMGEM
jgi:hypothetical protein